MENDLNRKQSLEVACLVPVFLKDIMKEIFMIKVLPVLNQYSKVDPEENMNCFDQMDLDFVKLNYRMR